MPAFPYLAKATIKYKSPHKQDLTFAKGETIRVTGIAPKTDPSDDDDDDDDDWLIGETLDGSRSGTFPGGFVEPTDEVEDAPSHEAEAKVAEAMSAPSAPGAIPSDAATDLQSSVVEEAPLHQAEVVPEAAREAAQKGETEQAGFGAPLPPRPPSPDDEDDQVAEIQQSSSKPASDSIQDGHALPEATGGAAAVGAAAGLAGAAAAGQPKNASTTEASSPAATRETITASSPTKSPPAVASKPVGMSNSFRDRLAAFNKPAESAPPPLPKGKPGGWKRPTPASSEAKPILPGAPAAASASAAPKPAPTAQSTETHEAPATSEPSSGGGAFSAADAQTSIKMSLKERMAALQRNEAAASDAAPQLKPKPSVPGKIGADRRNVALQGMGLAPGAAVPPRKSSAEAGRDAGEPAAEAAATGETPETDAAATPSEEVRDPTTTTTDEAGATNEGQEQLEEADEPKEALTEEEQEAERRAAIAKRMAALGARRMGGGPTPFGGPKPPARKNTSSSIGSAAGTTSEPGIGVPTEIAASEGSTEVKEAAPASATSEGVDSEVRSPTSEGAEEEPKVLAVPRRTAAPRKRKPVAPAAAAAAGASAAVVGGAAVAEEADNDNSRAEPESGLLQSEPADGQTEAATAAAPQEEATTAEHGADHTDAPAAESTQAHTELQSDAPTAQEAVADQQLDDEDPEIAENQRQLEEYLRGEGFYEDQVNADAQVEPEVASASALAGTEHAGEDEQAPQAVDSVPREDVTSPKPPSRPPSTRPPVPKTNLPPAPAAAGVEEVDIPAPASRRGSVIPPVPTTSLPVPVGSAAEQTEETGELQPGAEDAEEGTGPVLAAPQPRMAVPTEDPEDEELLAAAEPSAVVHGDAATTEEVAQEQPEEQELTEEEQEAQRRANLARRMAALGGQRIGAFPGMAPPPIMGAPMPARKAPAQAAEETEVQSREAEDAEEQGEEDAPLSPIRGPPRGGMAIPGLTAVPGMNASHAESEALERARSPGAGSVDTPARLASPPPVPTSPPPKPMSPPPARALPPAGDAAAPPMLPPGRPASTAPMPNLDEAIRSASPANSSLGRRSSMKPPVPQGISAHSRESSIVEDREIATSPPSLPVSPPPLPSSPPPRPSSRAPPLPGQGVPPRRQGSSASYASMGGADQQDTADVPSAATTPASELLSSSVPPRTEASLPPTPAATGAPSNISVGARQSSRDLDLMPSSQWWRHGVNPLRLPPTVAGRPDAILYADTSSNTDSGVAVHRADIYMLFEDYSTTTISLSFQDDDAEEAHTSLTQRHSFPPAKPSAAQLKQWSSTIGAPLAKLASDTAKQTSSPIGDGSPRAFLHHILSSTPLALPPVGTSLGAPLLTQVGPTLMDTPPDEVRPGDLVSASQADFRGKKGLAPYHTTLGMTEPVCGVVVDVESKKNKLRCVIQSPAQKRGAPEEVSLRLDDLKSGIVKVFRVPPREGWVEGW